MGLREKYFKTEKTKKKIYRTVAVRWQIVHVLRENVLHYGDVNDINKRWIANRK